MTERPRQITGETASKYALMGLLVVLVFHCKYILKFNKGF